MRFTVGLLGLTIALALGLALANPAPAQAVGLRGAPTIWLTCENGRNYSIRPAAVSADGDLVTGFLTTGNRQSIHVRLIPMGNGYRYAGRGVWFDGARENVYLYLSKYRSIACTVGWGPEQVRG